LSGGRSDAEDSIADDIGNVDGSVHVPSHGIRRFEADPATGASPGIDKAIELTRRCDGEHAPHTASETLALYERPAVDQPEDTGFIIERECGGIRQLGSRSDRIEAISGGVPDARDNAHDGGLIARHEDGIATRCQGGGQGQKHEATPHQKETSRPSLSWRGMP
jgi:hypothetical protein